MNPEWLRYYIAAKLNAKVEDVDFNPDDFIARVNSDLIGKYVNIASRASNFITKYFDGHLGFLGDTKPLLDDAHAAAQSIGEAWETREYGKAIRETMAVADRINAAFDAAQPWLMAKDAGKRAELQDICSRSLHGFKLLSVLLAPVLPRLTERVARQLFGMDRPFDWDDAQGLPTQVAPYQHLMQRVEEKQFDALFGLSSEEAAAAKAAASGKPAKTAKAAPAITPAAQVTEATAAQPGGETLAPTIGIDDFAKIDLRIAKILLCEKVEGSTKLLKLTLDAGEDKPRTVFSGIASAYQPEQLTGKYTVMVANLAPRKMKFGVSEGMVLAASHADEKSNPGIFVLEPTPGAVPGMRVR